MITVAITCYNYGKYLKEAIDSVLQSNYDDYDLLVVDDGSTDNTREVAEAYGDRLKYIYQENRGLVGARMTSLLNAKSDWFLPLDADDMISPIYLERIAEIIKEKPDVDVISCDLQHFGDMTHRVVIKLDFTKEDIKDYNPIPYCSAVRVSALKAIGGWNPKMCHGWEDALLWRELFVNGYKFYHFQEPHFLYRRHGSSMIDESNSKWLEYNQTMLKNCCPKLFGKNP